MKLKRIALLLKGLLFILGAYAQNKTLDSVAKKDTIVFTETEWKQRLSPMEYMVLREKATERPFTGAYENFWDTGVYSCKACGLELFHSATKFDAHCGWPSFYKAADKSHIVEHIDSSFGMVRIEVVCARCGGHLGHVFEDGPAENGGMRYCINSASLGFARKP